jgi:hypothetical protein
VEGRIQVGVGECEGMTVYERWTSYTYINITKKLLAIALSGVGRLLKWRDHGEI